MPGRKAPNLLKGQAAFRRALAKASLQTAKDLQFAYQRAFHQTKQYLLKLEQEAAANGMTPRKLARLETYRRMMDQYNRDAKAFEAVILRESRRLQDSGGKAGLLYGNQQLDAIGLGTGHNQPDPQMIRSLQNYTDSPAFMQRLNYFGKSHAEQVQNLLLTGAAQGRNPVAIARDIRRYLGNVPMFDAVRTARTVQLWSARQGTITAYRNSGVVTGWVWSAALGDKRTCMGCIAQHGTRHPLHEMLQDHHMGRCAMIPITPETNLVAYGPTGEEWFSGLSERDQIAYMGKAKFMAWKDGAFKFSQLSTTYQDPVYGTMRREATLKQLVGTNTALDYRQAARSKVPVKVSDVRKPYEGNLDGAKNYRDVEDWLKRTYPHMNKVDLSGCHIDPLKEGFKGFHEVAQDFPEVAKRIKGFTAYTDGTKEAKGLEAGCFAYASPGDHTIGLNRLYWGTHDYGGKAGNDNPSGRWTIQGPGLLGHARSTMIHEFGHHVKWWLHDSTKDLVYSRYLSPSGVGLLDDLTWGFFRGNRQRLVVSQYARDGGDPEFAAECFSGIYNLDKKRWPAAITRYKALLDFVRDPANRIPRNQTKWLDTYKYGSPEWEAGKNELNDLKAFVLKKFGVKY